MAERVRDTIRALEPDGKADLLAEEGSLSGYWRRLSLESCPRPSVLGSEITHEWLGVARLEQVELVRVPSTFQIDGGTLALVDDRWNVELERERAKGAQGKLRNDGAQARFEGTVCSPDGTALIVKVSPTAYRLHNILRDAGFYAENGLEAPQDRMGYPNPFTVYAVQVTTDGKILAGKKNSQFSDQTDIGLLGAGFLGRTRSDAGGIWKPNSVLDRVRSEIEQETLYKEEVAYDIENAAALAIVNGANRDTTITVYVPLKVSSHLVGIGNNEHSELILIDDAPEAIMDVVNTREELADGTRRFICADHMIGSLEAYMLAKRAGLISHPYR